MPELKNNSTEVYITKNGVPLSNLDLGLYVTTETFNELKLELKSHENSPYAHDEHIKSLIDEKLTRFKKDIDSTNKDKKDNKLAIYAIIISILTLIVTVISTYQAMH